MMLGLSPAPQVRTAGIELQIESGETVRALHQDH
jgi:hypothetical protein